MSTSCTYGSQAVGTRVTPHHRPCRLVRPSRQGGGYGIGHSRELAPQSSPVAKPSQVSASMRSPTTYAARLQVLDKKRQQDGGIIPSFRGLLYGSGNEIGRLARV